MSVQVSACRLATLVAKDSNERPTHHKTIVLSFRKSSYDGACGPTLMG